MGSWIFQSNPDFYDVTSALKALPQQTWLVNQHRNAIHSGDIVFLWETGKYAGVIGTATVLTEPAQILEDPAEGAFTKQPDKFAGLHLRVRVRIDEVLEQRVSRQRILGDEVLAKLPNISFANGTNYPITTEQEARLREMIANPIPDPVVAPKPTTAPPGAITLERTGELLQAVLSVLNDEGPMKIADLLNRSAGRLTLSEYDLSRNNSGQARWETAVRWYSLDAARAGWLKKQSGIWSITPSGTQALALSPMEFITQAHAAYTAWQKAHKRVQPANEVELDDLDSLASVLEGRNGPAWWVNQGDSYTMERDGGYLEAPTQSKAGHPLSHHVAIKKLRLGDVVLHYANSAIRAVSRVSEPAQEAPGQPPTLVAKVEYHEFDIPMQLSFIPLALRTPGNGPFTQQGTVQQVYLSQLSEAFVSGLLSHVGSLGKKPKPTRLADVVTPQGIVGLFLRPAVVAGAIAALDAGSHVILTGPPGTGKTHLAQLIAQAAAKGGYTSGYVLATASSDWSTFDTLGGYMPNPSDPGKLRFESGLILDAIASDKWLVLDEINRTDADKAFGALLTLLAGFNTELSFRGPSGERYQLRISDGPVSYFDVDTSTYHIGKNWRIIATMNTRDKNSLYALSYAFMRRFSFVYVGIPTQSDLAEILNARVASPSAREAALKLAASSPVPLGPAVLISIGRLIAEHGDLEQGIGNAVAAYFLPQLEGRDPAQVAADIGKVRAALGVDRSTELAWLEIAGGLIGSTKPEQASELFEDAEPDLEG